MEPPAVTSCGVGGHSSSGLSDGGGGQQKRDLSAVAGFIQIDPQISFNSANRAIQGDGNASHVTTCPQLASLTTVSMAGAAAGNSGYGLVPMSSSSYISALKMESMEHLGQHSQLHSNLLEKTNFGNGPAGLLSPLHLEGSRRGDPEGSLGLLSSVSVSHLHRPNGGSRTSDLLNGIRRSTNNVAYIKEEINPVSELGGYQSATSVPHHHDTYGDSGAYSMQGPTAQELERMANAETPPALSNVEITSSILASLSRDSPPPNIQQHSPHQATHFIVHQMSRQPHQHQMVQRHAVNPAPVPTARRSKAKQQTHNQNITQNSQSSSDQTILLSAALNGTHPGYGPMGPGAGVPRATYSTTDTSDPLNAEIDDEIYIDTKDLCKRVAYELKQHSIPQAIFAERILCRSQGTLSDLLRNPKPWNRLKSGRETFRRMFNWLQQPLHIRLSILDMYKGPMASGVIPPPTPAQNSRHHHRNRRISDGHEDGNPPQKRPRLVFTDIQKRTLQAIFKETQRPSREMQQTIAEHLRLDMSTVSNFFMNARRRSRNGNGMGDEPAPYQQVQTITPPPDSPPTAQQHHRIIVTTSEHQQLHEQQQQPHHHHHHPLPVTDVITTARRSQKSSGIHHYLHHNTHSSASNLSHIEETVDEVVTRSVAYARSKQQQQEQHQQQQFALAMQQNIGAQLMDHRQQQPPIWEEDDLSTAEPSELQFLDESVVDEEVVDEREIPLHQHKMEKEEESAFDDHSDISAAAKSIFGSSFTCKKREVYRSDDEDNYLNTTEEAEEGPKTPPPSTSMNLVVEGKSNDDEKIRNIEAERTEMIEAEAPTEPGTPLRQTDENSVRDDGAGTCRLRSEDAQQTTAAIGPKEETEEEYRERSEMN
uniref:One cut domain family member n=1 Tax=Globodera rostochiensis TaxID=31243 RepID=A0A914HYT8_GLORO